MLCPELNLELPRATGLVQIFIDGVSMKRLMLRVVKEVGQDHTARPRGRQDSNPGSPRPRTTLFAAKPSKAHLST